MVVPTKEISLYFHIPFCTKKCPYCHFYVVPDKQEYKDLLLHALKLEWARWSPQFNDKKIVSVYFGGGTPFLFGAKAIQTILDWIPLSSPCEITLEANPENVTLEAMQAYKLAGINRVSMGVQSLDDSSLQILGRKHSAETAIQAILNTERSGISNISIDLMYELPHQTLTSWENTLRQVGRLPITHLSLYNLTIEPHTVFFKYRQKLQPHIPQQEESLQMLDRAVASLREMGLKRYEISAFAKEGFHSIHNTGYWLARPFIGFGPSAFSYWDQKRFRNIANLNKYATLLEQGKPPIDFEEKLPMPDALLELFAIALRMVKGVHLPSFLETHGQLPPSFFTALHHVEQKGWLNISPDQTVTLTPQGLLFYDSVAEELI